MKVTVEVLGHWLRLEVGAGDPDDDGPPPGAKGDAVTERVGFAGFTPDVRYSVDPVPGGETG